MNKKLFWYLLLIFIFLFLFTGCFRGSEEKIEDHNTLPDSTNRIETESSDSVSTPEIEIKDVPTETENEDLSSEIPTTPVVQPTPSFDEDSPLEIEVTVKQPWEESIAGDQSEDIMNSGSDDTLYEETESVTQDSTSSQNDTQFEDGDETDQETDGDGRIEDIPTSSPTVETEPDFSLEIE